MPILTVLILSSCSTERRIKGVFNRLNPKEVITYAALNYPEYLKADTVRIDSIVEKEVPIKVPSIIKDTTIFIPGADRECLKNFHYDDKYLTIDINIINDRGKFKYHLKTREIKDTVRIPIHVKGACPPCPTEVIVQEAQKEIIKAKTKTTWQSFQIGWFWLTWIIILIYLIIKGIQLWIKMYKPT